MTTATAPMTQSAALNYDKGLANTIVADSQMSFIDGAKGILEYVGIEIDTLARNSTFEEVVYLLWNRRLPRTAELDSFLCSIQAEYDLPPGIWELIKQCPKDASPMHALRTLVSALSMFDPEADDDSPTANHRKSIRLLAKTPALIANFDRHRKGKPFAQPDKSTQTTWRSSPWSINELFLSTAFTSHRALSSRSLSPFSRWASAEIPSRCLNGCETDLS